MYLYHLKSHNTGKYYRFAYNRKNIVIRSRKKGTFQYTLNFYNENIGKKIYIYIFHSIITLLKVWSFWIKFDNKFYYKITQSSSTS